MPVAPLGVSFTVLWPVGQDPQELLDAQPAATRRRPVVQPHQHGSLTGYTYGCHCTSCKAANARAGGKRRRRQAMGLTGPDDRLPYAPTHTAVCGLRSAGYTSPQIARLTGLSSTQISRLLRPGGQYVTRDVAERIDAGVRLSARVPPVDRLAARYLDVHGTRLRIRALMSQGWAVEELGRRLGHTGGYLSPVLYTSRPDHPWPARQGQPALRRAVAADRPVSVDGEASCQPRLGQPTRARRRPH